MSNKTKKDLEPFNEVIQICPDCGKVDVYLDDGHECNYEAEQDRILSNEYYD